VTLSSPNHFSAWRGELIRDTRRTCGTLGTPRSGRWQCSQGVRAYFRADVRSGYQGKCMQYPGGTRALPLTPGAVRTFPLEKPGDSSCKSSKTAKTAPSTSLFLTFTRGWAVRPSSSEEPPQRLRIPHTSRAISSF